MLCITFIYTRPHYRQAGNDDVPHTHTGGEIGRRELDQLRNGAVSVH